MFNKNLSSLQSPAVSSLQDQLRRFSNAKHELIAIFEKVKALSQKFDMLISADADYLFNGNDGTAVVQENQSSAASIKSCIDENMTKIQGILKILARNSMKVCFFGRTSNGKSTVINCMLRDRILPAGLGHTTNCFLQIEGIDDIDQTGPYCLLPGSSKRYGIEVLNKLNDEFEIGISQLVHIMWPKTGCRFLNEDIVLIDSPGIDVSADLDSWIEEYCLDADVFVLVCNAEAVLSRTERQFFVSVSQKLSSPNIFILNNRWDMTSDEPKREDLRNQHQRLEVEFLYDKLKVCADQEAAKKRIFFVSAKEALSKRISELNPKSDETLIHLSGHEERTEAFNIFEHEFTRCLSHSALLTKFKPHADQGVKILIQYVAIFDSLSGTVGIHENKVKKEHREAVIRAEAMENELHDLTAAVKDRIKQVVTTVQDQVSSALREETVRLSELVDKFDVIPFNCDSDHVAFYKSELNKYMEKRLGENLSDRLGRALTSITEDVQKDVRERVVRLLSDDSTAIDAVKTIVNRTDFSAAYRLYFSNLCADFKEDISFRFSLSPTVIMHRLSEKFRSYRRVNHSIDNSFNSVSDDAMATIQRYSISSQPPKSSGLAAATNTLMAFQALTFFSHPQSAATVAILGGSTLAFRGWKIMLGITVIFGGIYAIERTLWTKKAMQKTFKKQYVEFASAKLKMVTEKTSGNASRHVQEELSLYFAQVCKFADESKDRVLDYVKSSDEKLNRFSAIQEKINARRNSAFFICTALNKFSNNFLN